MVDWKTIRRAARDGTVDVPWFMRFEYDPANRSNPQHPKGHKARQKQHRHKRAAGRKLAARKRAQRQRGGKR